MTRIGKVFLKATSLLLVLCLSASPSIFVKAENDDVALTGEENQSVSNITSSIHGTMINELLAKRAALFLNEEVDTTQLNNIDEALTSLGVDFLTDYEADKILSQKDTLDTQKDTLDTQNISINVAKPDTSTVQWMEYRYTNYKYNGESYNIQVLFASPSQQNSNLKGTGARVLKYNTNWKAGAASLIKSVATVGLTKLYGAGLLVTIYNALSGSYSALNESTEVKMPNINYTWAYTTNASFIYIRKEAANDIDQYLSFVSTQTTVAVAASVPSFSYKKSNGSWVSVTPQVQTTERNIFASPANFNSVNAALAAYTNAEADRTAIVGSIVISGPSDKTVELIYPVSPSFPGQIY